MWLERAARGVTYAITNATKIAGLYIGVKAATGPDPSQEAITMALAAFMMAGAQVSETAIMKVIERFFGVDRED